MNYHDVNSYFWAFGKSQNRPYFVRFLHYTVPRTMKTRPFQEIIRDRLRELTPNQSVLANYLKVDPSTISKMFTEGGTAICIDWLDRVRPFYQRTPAELVADPGAVILPVSPLESSLLDRFRRMSEMQRMALMAVLDWRGEVPVRGRRRTRLTHEEAVLVALWQAAERVPDVQSAVLDLLRKHPAVVAATQRHRVTE